MVTEKSLGRAVKILERGGVIALPTETVYGLVAYYGASDSWKKIFLLKGRGENKPLALFIKSLQEAEEFALVPPLARELSNLFCPGPITIVLEKKEKVDFPWSTVGFRMPDHPFVQALLSRISPLWSTSANRTGKKSACTPEEVRKYFGERIEMVVEEGKELVKGVPSTVVKVARTEVRILREGAIKKEEVKKKLKIDKIGYGL
ncbi:MAG: threonylcarbamoyl-AMP synthase [Caldiserica bacterium]|nr:threonylcarbamoyl-AMP synthase [Caldisericota bacterium]